MIQKNFLKIKKIIFYIKKIIINKYENDFILYNKKKFKNSKKKYNQILIENTNLQPNHIAISHFSKVLSEIHDAEIVCYEPRIHFGFLNKIKSFILKFKVKKIFASFGVSKFLDNNVSDHTALSYKLLNILMSEIKNKTDLLNLTIDGIWVGDIIYDQYLGQYKVPTVKLKSEELRKTLFEFCNLYYHWKSLFSKKNIKSVVISHACYFMGLPGRMAIEYEIPVYQANLQTIYYLSKKNIFPSSEFHSYKDKFEKLEDEKKKKGIMEARRRLNLIFEGNINIDQFYIKNSAYSQNKISAKIIENKSPIKILIASHSFYDAPNGLGKTLFSDFFEWLEFIGELSNKTKYEWYIKTHPGIDILDKKTIDSFVSRFKRIILVPDKTSHNQLINEGINIVMTVYGSIGIEYAAKNITVVNASLNNPHINYDFNINPQSQDELKNIILNLENYVNLDIRIDDVYQCYYMKYLYYDHNIFFSEFKSVMDKIGGYYSLYSANIYKEWMNYLTTEKQNKIELNLKKFVLSGDYKIKSNFS